MSSSLSNTEPPDEGGDGFDVESMIASLTSVTEDDGHARVAADLVMRAFRDAGLIIAPLPPLTPEQIAEVNRRAAEWYEELQDLFADEPDAELAKSTPTTDALVADAERLREERNQWRAEVEKLREEHAEDVGVIKALRRQRDEAEKRAEEAEAAIAELRRRRCDQGHRKTWNSAGSLYCWTCEPREAVATCGHTSNELVLRGILAWRRYCSKCGDMLGTLADDGSLPVGAGEPVV